MSCRRVEKGRGPASRRNHYLAPSFRPSVTTLKQPKPKARRRSYHLRRKSASHCVCAGGQRRSWRTQSAGLMGLTREARQERLGQLFRLVNLFDVFVSPNRMAPAFCQAPIWPASTPRALGSRSPGAAFRAD